MLQEIDDQQDAVDYAIHVLLTAGMSTPALRYISRAGVDIEYAAYAEITAAAVLLIPFELGSLTNCTSFRV
jgi:predicted Fe-Mo cluster-binding NifX family protein